MSNVQYNTLLRHSDAVKLRTKISPKLQNRLLVCPILP